MTEYAYVMNECMRYLSEPVWWSWYQVMAKIIYSSRTMYNMPGMSSLRHECRNMTDYTWSGRERVPLDISVGNWSEQTWYLICYYWIYIMWINGLNCQGWLSFSKGGYVTNRTERDIHDSVTRGPWQCDTRLWHAARDSVTRGFSTVTPWQGHKLWCRINCSLGNR